MSHISEFLVLHGGFILFLIVFAEQIGLRSPGRLGFWWPDAGGQVNLFTAILWAMVGCRLLDRPVLKLQRTPLRVATVIKPSRYGLVNMLMLWPSVSPV
jgi:hypothetical protein